VIRPVSAEAGVDDASVLKGKTPVDLTGFKPGTYVVSFQRPGWKPYEQTVEVKAAQNSSASFDYKPAKVRIETTPDDATVTVNGKKVGETPVVLDDVPEGAFQASVSLDGYEPEDVRMNMPFGGSAERKYNLLKLDRIITDASDLSVLPSHEGGNSLKFPAGTVGAISGTVYVRVQVGTNGRVLTTEVVNNGRLSGAIVTYIENAVRSWSFTPGSRKGFPMRCEVVIPVTVGMGE
jgi:hypothetical protein